LHAEHDEVLLVLATITKPWVIRAVLRMRPLSGPEESCVVRQVRVRGAIAIIAVVMGLFLSWGGSSARTQVEAEAVSKPGLRELVETYYRCGDSKGRSQAASAIVSAAEGDIDKVASEFPNVHLWSDQPEGGVWTIPLPSGESVEVTFRLPPDYEPVRAFPLLVVMPKPGETPQSALNAASLALGSACDPVVVIAPNRTLGGMFHERTPAANDLPALLREIRKHIHVDADSVFLFGMGAGGDAAWMAAIMYSFEFVGLVAVDSFPRVPYPEQTYTLLLPNLNELSVLSVWNAGGADGSSDVSPVAAFNRAIVDFAKRTSLPIVGVELPGAANTSVQLPEEETEAILDGRRSGVRSQVQHWFRYRGQGDCGWIRATEIAGDVWEDDQLSIVPAPTTDRDRFITDTIAEKSAFIGGRIDGQNITIETRRCGGVELRLAPGQADFTKPIIIVCNGRKRFEGLIRPSVADLLESAYEDWDFQHPVYARKTFAIRTDSPFEGP
jgi:pimeloyl-ACP methyl ester carboxylesterase